MQVWLAALCGAILKLDHSFKVVKRVRDSTAHKQFGAVLSIMNEFCQVRNGNRLGAVHPERNAAVLALQSDNNTLSMCRCWQASLLTPSPLQSLHRS
jgi:hypothetical protein